MKQTVTRDMFNDEFRIMDRKENFSLEGRNALFDLLESYEESGHPEIELDVIALCCEYNEDPIKEVLKNYNLESMEELEAATEIVWNDDKRVLYRIF